MEAATVEKRLATLESEIAQLKRLVVAAQPGETWLERVAGTFRDEPESEAVLRLGREIRRSDKSDVEGVDFDSCLAT